MKRNRIIICRVEPDSAAMDAGIEPGDFLLSINGQMIVDIFDYRFLTTDTELVIEIEKKNGELWEIEVQKDEYEDLGLDFEDPLISEAKSCSNKCVFCFIDQLPKGMRDTVYFKDDDSRLSFLSGNYVTLTNMKNSELDRIIRYKMTPVNVSVHTTNPELRKTMLRNRFAGDVLNKIRILTQGGITVNTQIVLCKGINDRAELDRTIRELSELAPGVASISVVPVGLTKWREGLTRLEPLNEEECAVVLEQVSLWQQKLYKSFGSRLVYLADEFYIKAGVKLPELGDYEDFPQIENGVGLMTLLIHEFHEYLRNHQEDIDLLLGKWTKPRKVSIATGKCAFMYIKQLAQVLEKRYNNLEVLVYPIENNFFGENVTVTGLLTGCDIVAQLKGKELGDELLLSESMLRSGEEVLLDDYTVEMLSKELNSVITIVKNNGEDLARRILGMTGGVD
jgi:putative radical SAM enzyme (TIGR03279 family)